jgi:inner membrane transporter RhtA
VILQAMGLIGIGSLGIQTSSAISAGLFAAFGPFAVSSLRMLIAAIILLAIFRPRLRGRSRSAWVGVIVYGVAMAAMNMSLYAAIEHIPLGVAVTLEFLGPCVVALLASRRLRDALCAIAALIGVVLISGPGGYFDLAGYAFGLAAAVFFGLYTIFAVRVGKTDEGLSGLALSVAIAALLTLPWGVPEIGSVQPRQWGLLALSAAIGVVIPYSVDTLAARITSARVIGTLFSVDPAMGSLIALLILGQAIEPVAIAGIIVVSLAGALVVWLSQAPAPAEAPDPAFTDEPEVTGTTDASRSS